MRHYASKVVIRPSIRSENVEHYVELGEFRILGHVQITRRQL